MKKVILIFLLALNITPAHAEQGGWVKVSAEGKIISGTLVCTPDVCGDVNSVFSKLTLQPGERYVQVTKADATGAVTGPNVLAMPTNHSVSATVNPNTDVATIKTTITEPLAPSVTVVRKIETVYEVEKSAPVTTIKEPVIEIVEPETIKENLEFINWLNLLNDLFQKLFVNFTLVWEL